MHLILASQSPRRSKLLSELGLEFEIVPADVVEISEGYPPLEVARTNSQLKADYVAHKNPDSLIIGSDTIVELKGNILGKPRNVSHAREMLRQLSGQTHHVLTAVSLRSLKHNIKVDFTETTKVTFKPLNDDIIDKYLSLVNTLDKAGSYGIQSYGDLIVESVEGPIDNVIGLPCKKLKLKLEEVLLN